MEKQFVYFDATADIGFKAYGNSLEESFENSAMAMFNIISNTNSISPSKELKFSITSEDEVSLLYDFLEQLLFLHEVEFMLFSQFNVRIQELNNEYKLDAAIKGEDINWKIHERGTEVKAVTFHQMQISLKNETYKTKVILDL